MYCIFYNQALTLANEFDVNCSVAEVLLNRLKMLLMQIVEEKEAPVEATNESESRDQGVENHHLWDLWRRSRG